MQDSPKLPADSTNCAWQGSTDAAETPSPARSKKRPARETPKTCASTNNSNGATDSDDNDQDKKNHPVQDIFGAQGAAQLGPLLTHHSAKLPRTRRPLMNKDLNGLIWDIDRDEYVTTTPTPRQSDPALSSSTSKSAGGTVQEQPRVASAAAVGLNRPPRYLPCGKCQSCQLRWNCESCLHCKLILDHTGATDTRPVCVKRICLDPRANPVVQEQILLQRQGARRPSQQSTPTGDDTSVSPLTSHNDDEDTGFLQVLPARAGAVSDLFSPLTSHRNDVRVEPLDQLQGAPHAHQPCTPVELLFSSPSTSHDSLAGAFESSVGTEEYIASHFASMPDRLRQRRVLEQPSCSSSSSTGG